MEYFEFSNAATYVMDRDSLPAEFIGEEAIPLESRIRLGYGGSGEEYLSSGRRDVQTMISILSQCKIALPKTARCLDFGCGGGRMLRHLATFVPEGHCWGCDTESRAIAWAQTYLSAKLRFFTNLREPHLPFEDGYFDFVYAGSVFSHLHDMAEFWLLELKRITKPETGVLYLTFQDDNSLAFIRQQGTPSARHYFEKLFVENNAGPLFEKDYKRIVIGKGRYSSQVFYKSAWLDALLNSFFESVALVSNGYGWQTAAILTK